MDRKISICVALNLKSIKRGWGVPLRFYYLLRFLDDGGCGKIELSDAVDILSEKLRQSKQNVRTILRKRGGVFWYVYGKRIYLNAIEKVAEEIGLESLGERIALYEQELTDKLTKFKARAIYSIAARDSGRSFDIHPKTGKVENKGGKIIARSTLTKLSGISRSTQRRYERAIHVKKTWTFGYRKITQDNWDKLPLRDGGIFEQRGQFLRDIDNDGINELVWQCPNRYTVDLDYIGKSRKSRSPLISPKANRPTRLYYDNPRSADKAMRNHQTRADGFYTIRKVENRKIYMGFTPCNDEN